jgi:hypothetical protein
MFECSSARYFDVRSITLCGTCDDAALSRYTSGFPLTSLDSSGKSFLIFATSQLPVVFGAVTYLPLRGRHGFRFRCRIGLRLPALPSNKFAKGRFDRRRPAMLLSGDLIDLLDNFFFDY